MSKVILILIVGLTSTLSAQSLPMSIDLSKYTPYKESQDGGTCFAYATTYTALTIYYNLYKGVTDTTEVNKNAFSPSFTASLVRKKKPLFNKLFTLGSCEIGGNIEKSSDVLVQRGAISFGGFGIGCSVNITNEQYVIAGGNKIVFWKYLIDPANELSLASRTQLIKEKLLSNDPVICAIYQTDYLMNNSSFIITQPVNKDDNLKNKNSNHAVCVVGYDDNLNGGSFLIKNNYRGFGKNGFAWITFRDFNKYFKYAIFLKPNFSNG